MGLLKEENVVQNRIIGQLKKLMLSNQTKPNRSCILGHKYCLVYHKRYNLVLTKLEDTRDNSKCVESESRENFKLSKDVAFMKKMTRRINALQSMYGVPAKCLELVSESLIHPELLSIWRNASSFNRQLNVLANVECPIVKTKSCKFNRLPKLRNIPLLYYPAKSWKKKLSPQSLSQKGIRPLSRSQKGSSNNAMAVAAVLDTMIVVWMIMVAIVKVFLVQK